MCMNVLPACMYVYYMWRLEEDTGASGTGGMDAHSHHMGLGTQPKFLPRHQALLTSELCLVCSPGFREV